MPRLTEQEQQEIIRYIEADNKRRVKSAVDCSALKPVLEPINKPIYKDMGVKRAVS